MFKSVRTLAAKYYSLSLPLGLKSTTVDGIKLENPKSAADALQQVIKTWLRQSNLVKGAKLPSWKTLCEAVDSSAGGEDPVLAKKIANNHPGSY